MNGTGGRIGAAARALVLTALLVPAALAAQSVNDYRLPGATPTPGPTRVQGPVDNDVPVVRGPQPQPSVSPGTAPTPSPAPGAAATPAAGDAAAPASPRPRAASPSRNPATNPAAHPVLVPVAAPSATPSTGPALPTGVPASETGAALPDNVPATPAVPAAASPSALPDWLPWASGGAIGLVLGLLVALMLRRRAARPLEVDFEPPVVREPAPVAEAAPPAALTTASEPRPQPAPAPVPAPPQPQAAPPEGLTIALEARRMSASLMATTLSYRLVVTNHGAEPLSALAVEGDMVSAHASLPPDQQIANGGQRLELRHALVALAPGESAEFTGDFRLPLAAVTPIRSGDAAYFVPLARLRVEAATPGGQSLICAQTFVVGEQTDVPDAALRPFRLDLGPRTYSRIGQRPVN